MILKNKVGILAIAEAKIDETFPTNEFLLDNYRKPYRLDNSKLSGGLLVYVMQDIPSKQFRNFTLPEDFQVIPFEISLKNQKWLIISIYNPNKRTIMTFLENLIKLLDFYSRIYNLDT